MMKSSTRQLAAVLALLVSGALGAGIALAVAAGFGELGKTTVVTTQTEVPATAAASSNVTGKALSLTEIYKRTSPGVVEVTSTSVVRAPANPFFQLPSQTEQSLGSGFVIDRQGHIVTNYHVISGASSIRVTFSNDVTRPAKVVGTDKSTDIAVLKVSVSPDALVPLSFGNSAAMEVGDEVLAIGNPFGLDRSATAGIVSAVYSPSAPINPLTSPNNFPIDNVIQTDAAINHGNSGGPLLNTLGQVIGVNTAIDTGGTGQGNVGIGFAVPSDTVKQVVAQLIKSGKAAHPFLGVRIQPVTAELARLFRLPVKDGLLVTSVTPGTGAAKAGIKGGKTEVTVSGQSYSVGGDIIVAADGKSVDGTASSLEAIIAAHKPGDKITLELYRGDKKMTVTVTLGNRP
jgi:S1-C subfamily serine protease